MDETPGANVAIGLQFLIDKTTEREQFEQFRAQMTEELSAAGPISIPIQIDQASLTSARAQLEATLGAPITVPIIVDTSGMGGMGGGGGGGIPNYGVDVGSSGVPGGGIRRMRNGVLEVEGSGSFGSQFGGGMGADMMMGGSPDMTPSAASYAEDATRYQLYWQAQQDRATAASSDISGNAYRQLSAEASASSPGALNNALMGMEMGMPSAARMSADDAAMYANRNARMDLLAESQARRAEATAARYGAINETRGASVGRMQGDLSAGIGDAAEMENYAGGLAEGEEFAAGQAARSAAAMKAFNRSGGGEAAGGAASMFSGFGAILALHAAISGGEKIIENESAEEDIESNPDARRQLSFLRSHSTGYRIQSALGFGSESFSDAEQQQESAINSGRGVKHQEADLRMGDSVLRLEENIKLAGNSVESWRRIIDDLGKIQQDIPSNWRAEVSRVQSDIASATAGLNRVVAEKNLKGYSTGQIDQENEEDVQGAADNPGQSIYYGKRRQFMDAVFKREAKGEFQPNSPQEAAAMEQADALAHQYQQNEADKFWDKIDNQYDRLNLEASVDNARQIRSDMNKLGHIVSGTNIQEQQRSGDTYGAEKSRIYAQFADALNAPGITQAQKNALLAQRDSALSGVDQNASHSAYQSEIHSAQTALSGAFHPGAASVLGILNDEHEHYADAGGNKAMQKAAVDEALARLGAGLRKGEFGADTGLAGSALKGLQSGDSSVIQKLINTLEVMGLKIAGAKQLYTVQ